MLFDRVIANPPFSLDAWGHETAAADAHGRFRFGVPPKTKGDFAFVQHMVATLNAHGKMGVVMPHGVLFRGASEGEIRKGLLQDDLIEAVVGLPTNLFYGTGIPAAILIINRDKPKARKGKVLFVEASRSYGPGTNQNHLRAEDVGKIVRTVREFTSEPGYAQVTDHADVVRKDFNLNIARYVETSVDAQRVDVVAAVAALRKAETARAEAAARMNMLLRELGYG
jgi:type I restriction enzyme M protein